MRPLVNPDVTPDIALLAPADDIKIPEGLPQPEQMSRETWEDWKLQRLDPRKVKNEFWFE